MFLLLYWGLCWPVRCCKGVRSFERVLRARMSRGCGVVVGRGVLDEGCWVCFVVWICLLMI